MKNFCYNIISMKKFLSLLLVTLLLIPFGTAALALHAGAADTLKVEQSSNTAFAENSVESADGATITGKVEVPFSFNNDGKAVLKQGGNPVKIVNIAADGTYLFDPIVEGTYDLVVSIPGWTEFTVTNVEVSENEDVEIYDNLVFAGDVDNSGVIDIQDVATALTSLGNNVSTANISSDVDHDKNVNIGDISIILAADSYGQTAYTTAYFHNGWTHPY